jgi:hypothetical protein
VFILEVKAAKETTVVFFAVGTEFFKYYFAELGSKGPNFNLYSLLL